MALPPQYELENDLPHADVPLHPLYYHLRMHCTVSTCICMLKRSPQSLSLRRIKHSSTHHYQTFGGDYPTYTLYNHAYYHCHPRGYLSHASRRLGHFGPSGHKYYKITPMETSNPKNVTFTHYYAQHSTHYVHGYLVQVISWGVLDHLRRGQMAYKMHHYSPPSTRMRAKLSHVSYKFPLYHSPRFPSSRGRFTLKSASGSQTRLSAVERETRTRTTLVGIFTPQFHPWMFQRVPLCFTWVVGVLGALVVAECAVVVWC